MNQLDFNNHIDELFSSCNKLLIAKGRDYAQASPDRLINFKQVGATLGQSPAIVLMTYVSKHLDSIIQAIQANPDKPATSTEPLTERIRDVINYMGLLDALLVDMAGVPVSRITVNLDGSTLEKIV